MIKKPVIGLNMSLTSPANGDPGEAQSPMGYVDAVQDAGGVPLCIPPHEDMDAVRAMLPCLRGFLFVGGLDYMPHHYGGHPQPDHELIDARRDRFDMALARLILEETDLAVLGICGGHQLLSIALGGALIQDIGTEWTPPNNQPRIPHAQNDRSDLEARTYLHPLKIYKGSLVARSTGSHPATALPVNSFHHQAVDPFRIGRDLRATAWSADGIIEALEPTPGSAWSRSGRFLLGVQWHPERMLDQLHQRRLFRSFIEAVPGGSR